MRTLVLLIASPHFSAELWYDQLRPSFFSVVNGGKTASQKVRIFCAASHLAGKKFPIAYQLARVTVLQTGADALGQAQRHTLEGDNGFILRWPQERQAATGMVFEPWHWRYVGRDNALAIRASGLSLEEYLALEQTK